MSAFGIDFTIYKKRSTYAVDFLGYWDGRESAASVWDDRDTNDNDLTPASATLLAYGYRANGGATLTGNLGLTTDLTAFTIGCVITRNDNSNNEGVVYRAFGSNHYPRIYFVGTTLYAEVELDGVMKQISVASVDTYIKVGQPVFIVFRGDATTGIELLIDGTVRGTNTDTGTDFDVSTSDIVLMDDVDQSYEQKGEMRMCFVTSEELSDAKLTVFRNMLEYEGYFDVIRDKFSKWSGSGTITSTPTAISNSPYNARSLES